MSFMHPYRHKQPDHEHVWEETVDGKLEIPFAKRRKFYRCVICNQLKSNTNSSPIGEFAVIAFILFVLLSMVIGLYR